MEDRQQRPKNFTLGEVVRIRLTPPELSACVSVVETVGVPLPGGTSLSGMVRAAINILINSVIKCGAIPEPSDWSTVGDYVQFKRSYTRSARAAGGRAAYALQMEQLHRMRAGMPPVDFGNISPLEQTDEEIALELEQRGKTVEAAQWRKVRESSKQARPGREVTTRIDPRRLRRDELRFRSEQDPTNMSQTEFKELRRLERELQ